MSNSYAVWKGRGLDCLSRKPQTVFEFKKKMRKKGCDDETIEKLCFEFGKANYLNDQAYVREWLETVALRRGYGVNLIIAKLKDKGIAGDVIERGYCDYFAPLEKELAVKVACKKARTLNKKIPQRKKTEKIAQFLNGRGFEQDVVFEALANIGLWE